MGEVENAERRAVIATSEALKEIRKTVGFLELAAYLKRKADELSREVIRKEAVTEKELAEARGAIHALEAVVGDIDLMIEAGDELRADERDVRELSGVSGRGELAL